MAFCLSVNAQSGTWVWMNGSDSVNTPGSYGVQGVASTNNTPPGLYNSAQWTDLQGNFWIYGGIHGRFEGDLWKYDPNDNTWTWIKGSGLGGDGCVYGTQGVPSANNTPGDRGYGCAAWTDTAGDLWLFGGVHDSESYADLWRYHIATNEWAWMSGSQTGNASGVYGNMYQASALNYPPSRSEINTSWTDASGNLWLFGGEAHYTFVEDMWQYIHATNQWVWMNGSQQSNVPAFYGTLGVEDPQNSPGGRTSYTHWVQGNYLIVSGGEDITGSVYNDVWKFNLNTYYWTWIGGDEGPVDSGVYLNYCSVSEGDRPIGRFEQRAAQVPCSENLFVWGGFTGNPGTSLPESNELWSFDLNSKKWRWISGYDSISPVGNFGIKGVSSPENMPPGNAGTCFWGDKEGNLWLWGGYNGNNAMWKYIRDPSCIPLDTGFDNLDYQLSQTILCNGDSALITFSNDSSLNIQPGNSVRWLTGTSAILKPDTTTTYQIIGITPCGSAYQNITIQVNPGSVPITASKTQLCAGDTTQLCAPVGYVSYNWSNGQTSTCISTDTSGAYTVTVTGAGNCRATSNAVSITVSSSLLNYVLSDTVICKGDSALLGFSGDSSLSIEPSSSTAWINNSNVFLKPDSTTTYRINGITPCGVGAFEYITIRVVKSTIGITSDNTAICPGDTAKICAPTGFTNYHWNNSQSTACINVTEPGNYYLTVSESAGCSATSNTVTITQYPNPQAVITDHHDTLIGTGGISYQWFLNNVLITAATSSIYVVNASGTYTLQATDTNGCTASTSKAITVTGISEELMNNNINIFPNPTNTGWQLTVSNDMIGSAVEVFDVTGKLAFKYVIENQQSFINCAGNASGVYQLRIGWNGYSFMRKLVKM